MKAAVLIFLLLSGSAHALDCRETMKRMGADGGGTPAHLLLRTGQVLHERWRRVQLASLRPAAKQSPGPLKGRHLEEQSFYSRLRRHFLAQGLAPGSQTMRLVLGPRDYSPEQREGFRRDFDEALRTLTAWQEARFPNRPFSPEEVKQLNNELVERAARHLSASGVNVTVVYDPRMDYMHLEIRADGDHPMNRRAAEAQRELNRLQVTYSPGWHIRRGSHASFIPPANLIVPSHEDILNLDLESWAFRHERRHAFNHWSPERNLGESDAREGNLPEQFPNQYSRRQSHDEPDTHQVTLVDRLDDFVEALREPGKSTLGRARHLDMIYGAVLSGLETSRRNADIAAAWELKPPSRYETRPSGTYAVLESGNLLSSIPLPGSNGPNDPANAAILRRRIALLRDVSAQHRTQFELARFAIDKMYDAESAGREDDLLVLARALRGTMRPVAWNADGVVRRRDTDDLASQFNDIVRLQWLRLSTARPPK